MDTASVARFLAQQASLGAGSRRSDDDGGVAAEPAEAPRRTRRLADKILIALHHACDQKDFEVAERLLRVLETLVTRPSLTEDGTRRRNTESVVEAYERLWHLRHPAAGDS